MVSQRALALSAATPAIAQAHFLAESRPYHPQRDPGGYLNLGTAENRLVWDLLAPKLTGSRTIGALETRYAPLYGLESFRDALARYLSHTRRTRVSADDLIVVSGATAALDILASVLCDPDDAIVVPAPYYGAFDTDLTGRSGVRLVAAPMAVSDGFTLQPTAVEEGIVSARASGLSVRAIALSSPCNPLGYVYPPEALAGLLAVAAKHDLDIIADEIYAGCVYGPTPFTALQGPRVHTVWGFAKDFGVPGFKAGLIQTTDPAVRSAARELAYFAPLSTDTQAVLTGLVDDVEWADSFLAASRARLATSYAAAAGLLSSAGITHVPAEAGFSLWANLLPGADFAAEAALHRWLLDTTRVNILPGAAFASPSPGWFRICHAAEDWLVTEALQRVCTALANRVPVSS